MKKCQRDPNFPKAEEEPDGSSSDRNASTLNPFK